jgi:hypothetical protein
MRPRTVIILLSFMVAVSCAFSNDHPQAQTAVKESSVDFTKMILQNQVVVIFKTNCSLAGCHRGAYPKKKMNLEPDKVLESVLNVASQEISSLKRIDTKNPEKSYLLMKMRGEKGIKGERMPPDSPALKKEDIKIIEDWIFSTRESDPEKEKAAPQED